MKKILLGAFLSIVFGLLFSGILIFSYPELFNISKHHLIYYVHVCKNRIIASVISRFSYNYAASQAMSAVVNIASEHAESQQRIISQNSNYYINSLGSGVIISSHGYILTSYHLLKNADRIYVSLIDGRTARASVVGFDKETDLAVLKVALANLKHIWFADSNQAKVGDIVLAIGNPYGIGQTVTQGIIGGIKKNNVGLSTYKDFIQTDAAINVGNSGGALVNVYGELIGINSMIFSHDGGNEGIGLAIPSNLVKFVVQSIIKHGRVVRGWLGIESKKLSTMLADAYGVKKDTGIVVTNVYKNSPADNAGISRGDILVGINEIKLLDGDMVMNMVSQFAPYTKVTLHILRNGKLILVEVVVGEKTIFQ